MQDFLANRLLTHPLDEVFDDFVINVRFQEGEPHFFEGFRNVLFGQDTRSTKFFQDFFELVAQLIQHRTPKKKAIEALRVDLRSPRKI